MLSRFTEDGKLDTSFAQAGSARLAIPGYDQFFIEDVAAGPGGRVVAAGVALSPSKGDFGGRLTLAALTGEGAPDGAFGQGGVVVEDELQVAVGAILTQPDGKVVVAATDGDGLVLIRYTAEGARDPGWGLNGIVRTPLLYGPTSTAEVAIQKDGRIVAAADALHDAQYTTQLAVVRYTADGRLDETFGDGGITMHPIAGNAQVAPRAVVLDGSQRVVVAGFVAQQAAFAGGFVARFTSSGQLDSTFGSGSFGRGSGIAVGLRGFPNPAALVRSGRSLFVAGLTGGVAVARLREDGTLERSFGVRGIAAIPSSEQFVLDSATLAQNGKLVLGGHRLINPNVAPESIVLARIQTRPTGVVTGSPKPLRSAQPRGARIKVHCYESCSLRSTMTLAADDARRYGWRASGPVTIGSVSRSLAGGRRASLRLRLSRLAAARLSQAARVRVRLVTRFGGVAATDDIDRRSFLLR